MVAQLKELARRGGFLALAALGKADYLTMAQLEDAADLTESPARRLRLLLVEMGLATVEEVPVRGVRELRVSLTPWGREVAKHLVAIEDILARGPPKSRR